MTELGVSAQLTRQPNGRFSLTKLVITGQPINARSLKAIATSHIEAVANMLVDPDSGQLRDPHAPGTAWLLPSHVAVQSVASGSTGTLEVVLTLHEGGGRQPAGDRRIALASPPLERPDGSDPDGFARRLAERYRQYVHLTHKPAALIAEESGVPVGTVHRWVREARQRGFLPPAHQGRAG